MISVRRPATRRIVNRNTLHRRFPPLGLTMTATGAVRSLWRFRSVRHWRGGLSLPRIPSEGEFELLQKLLLN
jgi:hypothetical protein